MLLLRGYEHTPLTMLKIINTSMEDFVRVDLPAVSERARAFNVQGTLAVTRTNLPTVATRPARAAARLRRVAGAGRAGGAFLSLQVHTHVRVCCANSVLITVAHKWT
jgi:hypothetical protein